MSEDFGVIWESIDSEALQLGVVRRRLSPESPFDIFLCQIRPSRERVFSASFAQPAGELWRQLRSSRGMRIRVDPAIDGHATIQLTATDERFHAVFDALLTDLVSCLDRLVEERGPSRLALDVISARLLRWHNCFSSTPDGLSDEKQVGLFGELKTLERLLAASADAATCVRSWVGPEDAHQDFRWKSTAVEIKTSRQSQPTAVRISSERQLQNRDGVALFLVHYAIDDRSDGIGQTLSELIQVLRQSVETGPEAKNELDDRLIEYGYLDVHADRYSRRLSIRFCDCYIVEEGFPRITELGLPPGVGKVSYTLSLAACEPFRRDPDDLFSRSVET